MATPQTTAQNADRISIGSAKLEVQAYTQDPESDPWQNLGLADDIEIVGERTFTDVEPGNGKNPLPLVLNESATVNFALWENYYPNLSLIDGGLSKTDASGTVRTMGGGSSVGFVRMRMTQLIPRNTGATDREVTTLYKGRLNGPETVQFKNKDDADPYNRKSISMLFEIDDARINEDRDQLLKQVFSKQYKVTFDSQGGSSVDSSFVYDGELLSEPADPTKEDHTFDGWFTASTAGDQWVFATDAVTEDITLYAQWTAV